MHIKKNIITHNPNVLQTKSNTLAQQFTTVVIINASNFLNSTLRICCFTEKMSRKTTSQLTIAKDTVITNLLCSYDTFTTEDHMMQRNVQNCSSLPKHLILQTHLPTFSIRWPNTRTTLSETHSDEVHTIEISKDNGLVRFSNAHCDFQSTDFRLIKLECDI